MRWVMLHSSSDPKSYDLTHYVVDVIHHQDKEPRIMARVVPPAKKRNPQDTTLRNLRALKERVKKLEQRMRMAEQLERLLDREQLRLTRIMASHLGGSRMKKSK